MVDGKMKYSFTYNDIEYLADIVHYTELTKEEIEKYKVRENTFLVHLFSFKGSYTFELFIGEDLEWHSHQDFELDPEIIQIIGLEIHNKSM